MAPVTIIVQKYGGTSVGDVDRIRRCAFRVKEEIALGHRVAVVVSAMAGTTNQLVSWAQDICPRLTSDNALKSYDMVISAGENITSGLMALALEELGLKSRAWQGWQLPILTDSHHTNARIQKIQTGQLLEAFARGEVPVVTGFQGINDQGHITTLGRGGSDTTAVALAAALKAHRCDIYTDVDGVYTADPRIVHRARKLDQISYEMMLELASQGAKVLETRSVEIAYAHRVPLKVVSSFTPGTGTHIMSQEDMVESNPVYSITSRLNECLVEIKGYPKDADSLFHTFDSLTREKIHVDMLTQSSLSSGPGIDLSFTVCQSQKDQLVTLLMQQKKTLGYHDFTLNDEVAKISVIGIGAKNHTDVLQQLLKTLSDKKIQLLSLSTSEISLSILIPLEYAELAVRSLHHDFELDAQGDTHVA